MPEPIEVTGGRTLKDAIGSVRSAQGDCVLLMGAGCSNSAGIPLANDLVLEVERDYPEAYQRAQDSAYARSSIYNRVMEELSPVQRQKLLNKYIDEASINWAHLALAQLFLHGKIDRVLTVNFDPLVQRACSLVNFFPAIYDLAVTDSFKPHRISPKALFYLHGQHTGFVTLNASEELQAHREKLQSIVNNTGVRRVWLVVGYSGEADPLLDVLTTVDCFDADLYWLGHEPQPSAHLLQSGLFSSGKRAFYVGGQDADTALKTLAQQLECFPPDLLVKPFAHLERVAKGIDFATGGEEASAIQQNFHTLLQSATALQSSSPDQDLIQANTWALSGEFQRVRAWFEKLKSPAEAEKHLGALAYVLEAIPLQKQADAAALKGELTAARALWGQAAEKYALALKIKPEMHEAAYNWGNALGAQAKAEAAAGDLGAARALWGQAAEKYALALKIKPDKHEAANNWGNALGIHAKAEAAAGDLRAARALWGQAVEKYALALKIKPELQEAANNWGIALGNHAKAEAAAGDLGAARALWGQAAEKYALALKIKPEMHEAANNWGNALDAQARVEASDGKLKAALALWGQAAEKYTLALQIKPNEHETAINWGIALFARAQAEADNGDLEAARALWGQAVEKYALALNIKPDKHQAVKNWGGALLTQAFNESKAGNPDGAETLRNQLLSLLTEQVAKYPGAAPLLAYNWACLYGQQGLAAESVAQLEISRLGEELPSKEHLEKDADLDPVRESPVFVDWWQRHFP